VWFKKVKMKVGDIQMTEQESSSVLELVMTVAVLFIIATIFAPFEKD